MWSYRIQLLGERLCGTRAHSESQTTVTHVRNAPGGRFETKRWPRSVTGDEMRSFVCGQVWLTRRLWQKGRSRGMNVSHVCLKLRQAGSTRLQHREERNAGSRAGAGEGSQLVLSSAPIVRVGSEHLQDRSRPVWQRCSCCALDSTRGRAQGRHRSHLDAGAWSARRLLRHRVRAARAAGADLERARSRPLAWTRARPRRPRRGSNPRHKSREPP